VLFIAATALVLFLLGGALVARVASAATRRLGLDPWAVAEWFGLAESPYSELVRSL
jgi:hypothetical protein